VEDAQAGLRRDSSKWSYINGQMPHFVIEKIRNALKKLVDMMAVFVTSPDIVNGSQIHVLGVAYKLDIDDVRESPAVGCSPFARPARALA
jgi:UDP-N-acetyl-D-mannosaminuronate dehydrogenase